MLGLQLRCKYGTANSLRLLVRCVSSCSRTNKSANAVRHGSSNVKCRPCHNGRFRCANVSTCVSSAASPGSAQAVFAASTLYHCLLMFLMLAAPKWKRTRQVVTTNAIFVPLAIAYGYLLACSWQPDTFSLILPGSLKEGLSGGFKPQFIPSITGISTLFSRTLTAASLWVHVLAINLFLARTIFCEALEKTLPVRHSLLLCAVFGPLGLLSHMLTQTAKKAPEVDMGEEDSIPSCL